MTPISTHRKKTCTKCFKCLKVYLTCFQCDAVYHAKCLLKLPRYQVDRGGRAFCCRNITFESDSVKEILASQRELVIVKREEEYDADKGSQNCLLGEEDSKRNKFKCEACYLEFANKEHLEDHYRKCPYIIQGGLIQEINRDEDLESCLHKEDDLEGNELKCENAIKDEAGLVCSFCNEENFQEESYEQHIKQCEGHYSQLNKVNNIGISSIKWKETHVHTNKPLLKCPECGYATKRRHFLKHHILSKHYDGKKRSAHTEYTLERHLRTNTNQKPFIRNRYDYRTAVKRDLNTPMKVEHSNTEKEYKCNDCKYSTHHRSKLVRHTRIHSNQRLFKCDICNYAATRNSNLSHHILARHSNVEKKYKCSDCKYSTHYKSNLVNHIRLHTKERPYKCDTCDFTAISKSNLNYHILVKHSNNVEKKYKCSECKYSTHQNSRLISHIRVHTKERPYKCDACDFTAVSKSNLNDHILAKHSNNVEKKYKCSDCEYSTHYKSKLVRHICVHTDEKPYKCDTCNYAAASKSNLGEHTLAKHFNAEKKYKCNDCKYSAHRKADLVKHTHIHATEKPFNCDLCNYGAVQRGDLKNHTLAKHSNAEKTYKCGDCEYSTCQKRNLLRHKRIHTNENTFKCGDCKYSTYQKTSLVRHMLTHTNEKPFKCDVCDYAATRNYNLTAHILKKHSNPDDT